ncbi:PAC2 family protein [Miniimonas arenae]|uniref:PAC2 family protein n=1 Tax=Miniimonas arenae TaxID=676201 RepID=UPI001FE5191C|nr:PAC2 family protein [Miniimonas arenae]
MDPSALFHWDLADHPPLGVPSGRGDGDQGRDETTGRGSASDESAAAPDLGASASPSGTPEAATLDETVPGEGAARPASGGAEALHPDDVTSAPWLPRAVAEIDVPVLVHALRGSMDAGHAGALVVSHLLATHASERVATFDVDELLDYRSRRPPMTFEKTSFTEYSDPELALDYLATDQGGVLLLHGVEPDLRWEKFASAVREIVERLGVRTTVGVHGIPMGVPHTRPIAVTSHGTREGLVDVDGSVFGTVQVPGSASSLLEYRLGAWGHDAMGFAVHVPHYLAQAEYPAAAAELVRRVGRVTGAHLDVTALERAAAEVASEVDRQIAESPEVAAVVQALENQYDAYQEAAGRSLLASEEVPTADELAAQFEAFLAEQGSVEDGRPDEAGDGERA